MGAADDQFGDKAAIADLVYTYATNIRNGDGAACRDLFTEDGSFEMLDLVAEDFSRRQRLRLEGREAIIAHIAGSSQSPIRVCPMIHNLLITIDGDSARSTCAMTAILIPGGGDLVGEYHDSFRRTANGWRFQSRQHTIFLQRPAPTAAASASLE